MSTRRGRPRHPDILTPRQWEVLELLRLRQSDQEIADRIGLSLDGAKYHVSEILGKLGVQTREEAALWQPEERRAWPSRAWKFVIAGAAAAALGGVALLTLGVITSGAGGNGPLISQDEAYVMAGSYTGFRWVAVAEAEYVNADDALAVLPPRVLLEQPSNLGDASHAWRVTIVTEGPKPDSLQKDPRDIVSVCGRYEVTIPDLERPIPIVVEGISLPTEGCGQEGLTRGQVMAFTGRMLGWHSGDAAAQVLNVETMDNQVALDRYGPPLGDTDPMATTVQSTWDYVWAMDLRGYFAIDRAPGTFPEGEFQTACQDVFFAINMARTMIYDQVSPSNECD